MTAYTDLELTSRFMSFTNQTGFVVVTRVVLGVYPMMLV